MVKKGYNVKNVKEKKKMNRITKLEKSVAELQNLCKNIISTITTQTEINADLIRFVSSIDNKNENNKEKPPKPVNKYKTKPRDLDMVVEYFREKNINEPEKNAFKFYNHYEASGWIRGKTKIKNWRMCLSSWDFVSNNELLKKPSSYKYECYKCDKELTLNKEIESAERYHDGCGGDYLNGQELINRRAEINPIKK